MALSDEVLDFAARTSRDAGSSIALEAASSAIKTKRLITVNIHNDTTLTLERASVYFLCGASDETIRERLKPNESMVFHARKAAGPVTTGVVGVIGYQITKDGKNVTVAIYFRVPYFNYVVKSNKWNVMLVEESMVNRDTYKKLIKSWITADGSWLENHKLENPKSFESSLQLSFSGSMSSSSKSTLEVQIGEVATTTG